MYVALVLLVADFYKQTEGWDLFDPAEVIARDFDSIRKLSSSAQQLQKEGNLAFGGGTIAWVHTLRGIENFEVRPQAREIWKHLARGFPFAREGAAMLYDMTGVDCNLEKLGEIPIGLSAEVQG